MFLSHFIYLLQVLGKASDLGCSAVVLGEHKEIDIFVFFHVFILNLQATRDAHEASDRGTSFHANRASGDSRFIAQFRRRP